MRLDEAQHAEQPERGTEGEARCADRQPCLCEHVREKEPDLNHHRLEEGAAGEEDAKLLRLAAADPAV
jgi:hypothetical protein